MADNAPVPRLSQAALERVLARAAELHATSSDAVEGLSDAELVELGREVGLSPEHLRLAMAEERARVDLSDDSARDAGFFGPRSVSAQRAVPGNAAQTLALLDSWMQREELLRPLRRQADRLSWEARRDFFGVLQTALNVSGRSLGLTSANEVGASAVPVDGTRTVVRLDASLSRGRQNALIGSSIAAGLALVMSAGVMTLVSLLPGAVVGVGVAISAVVTAGGGAIAWIVARSQRARAQRTKLALEHVLDRLERGEIRESTGLLGLGSFKL